MEEKKRRRLTNATYAVACVDHGVVVGAEKSHEIHVTKRRSHVQQTILVLQTSNHTNFHSNISRLHTPESRHVTESINQQVEHQQHVTVSAGITVLTNRPTVATFRQYFTDDYASHYCDITTGWRVHAGAVGGLLYLYSEQGQG